MGKVIVLQTICCVLPESRYDMKTKSFILTSLFVVVLFCLFTSCVNNIDKAKEPRNSDNIAVSSNVNKERGDDIIKYISNKNELSELLGDIDFTNIEVVDIITSSFAVWVLCEGTDDAMQFDEATLIELIPPAKNRILEKVSLEESNVLKYGIKYRPNDYVPNLDSDWLTEWFQLDRDHPNNCNILLYANFPYRISVDVNKIINE